MSIFSIFSSNKKKTNSKRNLDYLLDELKSLRSSKLDEEVKKQKSNELNKDIGVYFFDAALKFDDVIIQKILNNDYISLNKFTNDEGYNIVEYCLFNCKNEVFKHIYYNYQEEMCVYFSKIQQLFTIIIKQENLDLVEFFINNKNIINCIGTANISNKVNAANCLFLLIQKNRDDLFDLLFDNLGYLLDGRNIEASIIYFLTNNKMNELNSALSCSRIINMLADDNMEKIFALAVMNRNSDVIKCLLNNKACRSFVENSSNELKYSVFGMASSSN